MKQTIAIINFNTPTLTEACILSIRKQGCQWPVVVFDNSSERPFTHKLSGVKVIDNTHGEVIDFDQMLSMYPHRCEQLGIYKGSIFGSAKHIMTVQKLWELLPEGFVLMESDILLKKSIDGFFDERYSVVGYCQKAQPGNRFQIGRMLPMLCWMKVLTWSPVARITI